MKTQVIASLAFTSAVVLAGCSQDRTPSVSLPTEASFGRTVSTCSFPNASRDAKAYFASTKDTVFTLLSAMQDAYRAGGAVGAVTPGFAVLARLGVAANNGASQVKGSAGVGSTFANDVLGCMDGYPNTTDFAPALGRTGLFGVRNGSIATAVISRNLDVNGAPVGGTPLYGAEPTGATWPVTGNVLFYGSVQTTSLLAGQTPAGIVFDLKTLPSGLTFIPAIRAGVCDVNDQSARTLHSHSSTDNVILPPAGIPGFCTSPPPLTASRSFTQMLAAVFAPKPLYAFALGGGGAGLISGLSEIGPVLFVDSLSFVGTVPNAALSDTAKAFDNDTTTSQFNPIVQVRAVSRSAKNPLAGVTIVLTVVGNNGSYQQFNGTAVTDATGLAKFPDFYINKPGGYTITATAPEFGTVGTTTSNLFNISGQ